MTGKIGVSSGNGKRRLKTEENFQKIELIFKKEHFVVYIKIIDEVIRIIIT